MDFSTKALTEATAGAIGGLLSTTILYPLDTCKTKYQAEARQGNTCKYRSLFDVFHEALQQQKLASLYQGLSTKNVQSVIAGFVYFYSYSYMKHKYMVAKSIKQLGTGANLVIAAMAGACTATITQPLDTMSARMQTSVPGKASSLLSMIRSRGILQVFDGLGVSLLLTTNPAIQYTVFEQMKAKILSLQRRRKAQVYTSLELDEPSLLSNAVALTAFSAFVIGAISKIVATVLTYPLIRCKVIMQREDSEDEKLERADGNPNAGAPRSIQQAMKTIWQYEGVGGFYKGLHAQILKTVIGAALMLMVKEKVAEMSRIIVLAVYKAAKKRRGLKRSNFATDHVTKNLPMAKTTLLHKRPVSAV